MSTDDLRPGDLVHDRDDPDPNDAVIVTLQSKTAAEWTLAHRDGTLAEDNPDYPADAPAVTVVYVDDLREYGPPFDPTERTTLSMTTLNDSPVHYYTFPAPRLTVVESPATGLTSIDTESDDQEEESPPANAPDTDPEPAITPVSTTETDATTPDTAQSANDTETGTGSSAALQQLTTTLEENGLTVEQTDDETLTIERLGQTYHIRPGEGIEGDGALRSQLETIVNGDH